MNGASGFDNGNKCNNYDLNSLLSSSLTSSSSVSSSIVSSPISFNLNNESEFSKKALITPNDTQQEQQHQQPAITSKTSSNDDSQSTRTTLTQCSINSDNSILKPNPYVINDNRRHAIIFLNSSSVEYDYTPIEMTSSFSSTPFARSPLASSTHKPFIMRNKQSIKSTHSENFDRTHPVTNSTKAIKLKSTDLLTTKSNYHYSEHDSIDKSNWIVTRL